jgi:hypothetical protein
MDALLEMIRLRGGMGSLTEDLHLTLSGYVILLLRNLTKAPLFGKKTQANSLHQG